MLKGSYVGRQYFKDPKDRIPGDLDWVYLEPIDEETTASQIFSDWATAITEMELTDGVRFQRFQENKFWRRIDYAMSDDFPTVNTDLACWVGDQKMDFELDVSFNLAVEQPPIPLLYNPLMGDPFTIPLTAPISLQVAWKIHQTLVRPRFKDLFDLMHFVQHPAFDQNAFDAAVEALANECYADQIEHEKIKLFLTYDLEPLFDWSITEEWDFWRHSIDRYSRKRCIFVYGLDCAESQTDVNKLPFECSVFLDQFEELMQKAGFNEGLLERLPAPTLVKPSLSTEPQPTTVASTYAGATKQISAGKSGWGYLMRPFERSYDWLMKLFWND